ncbi:MAG: BlaI/MecI/CopY family transcriptional regulator [Akkermansiaceae bacterium]|jgi:predicted transcriptional regulator|nr:BlaI/MecI/CopY family transcriptional regulator [Akkermansiaceae bacterium]
MAASDPHPTNLELQALTVLWGRGPSTVAEVHAAMGETRERAYTTVLTVLRNLEAKRMVRHRAQGKAHVFEAACERGAVLGRAAREFVDEHFGGSLAGALLAILSAGNLSPVEKQTVQQQLTQHRTMPAKKAAKKVAKKAAVKKAPAKKAAAKKPAVKKAPAKKAAVKKAVVKKAPAKKAAKKAAKKVG